MLESGAIEVTETIRPRFNGSYNGIYRTIAVEHRTNGFRYKLRLSVNAATDADGSPLRYESKRDGDYLNTRIWVPGAADTVRTVRLSYGVTNGLRFFEADEGADGIVEAYDELYWNVTGTEWPVPIETASATVRLPPAVGGVRAHAFTGGYGATGRDATVDVTGTRIDVRTDRPLGFREGLTIGVGWDAGVVRRPTAIDRAGMYLFDNWPLFLPFFVLAFMYRRWNERGRDPEIGSIEPRYEPPGDLTPAEVGVIIDNRADLRDITATLIDLAVRGHLTIEEREEKDYLFKRRDDPEDRLAPHESALLRAVFGGRRIRRLSDLKDRFFKDLPVQRVRPGFAGLYPAARQQVNAILVAQEKHLVPAEHERTHGRYQVQWRGIGGEKRRSHDLHSVFPDLDLARHRDAPVKELFYPHQPEPMAHARSVGGRV